MRVKAKIPYFLIDSLVYFEMKIFLKTFLVILLTVVFYNTTFSDLLINDDNSVKNTKSIIELKTDINELKQRKLESVKQLDYLQNELIVKKFFNLNLSKEKQYTLNKLVSEYKINKQKFEEIIKEKSLKLEDINEYKKQLLENEKNFYKNLIVYIDIDKYNDYKSYVEERLIILNKQLKLDYDLIKKEVIIENKVKNIKKKINENDKLIMNNIIEIINTKINKILQKIILRDEYNNLSIKAKNLLFNNFIKTVETKIKVLEKNDNNSNTALILIKNKNIIIKNIKDFRDSELAKTKIKK